MSCRERPNTRSTVNMWNWRDLRSWFARLRLQMLSHFSVGGGQDVKIILRNYDSRSSPIVGDDESNRIQQKRRKVKRQSCKNYWQYGLTSFCPGSSRCCCRPSLLKLPNFLFACPSQYLEAIDQNSWRRIPNEKPAKIRAVVAADQDNNVCRESVSGRFVAALNSSADWSGSRGAGFVNKCQTSESLLNFVALFPYSLYWLCKERHISIIYDAGPAKPYEFAFQWLCINKYFAGRQHLVTQVATFTDVQIPARNDEFTASDW